MKHFSKIISLLLTIAILFSMCLGFSGCTVNPNDSALTRGEWIEALSEKMGLDEYQSNTKYFKDIDNNNPLFSFVQSCVEWGVLNSDDGSFFYEDFKATKGFVADTIVRASTLLNNDSATNEEIIACAIEKGILSSKNESNKVAQRKDLNFYINKAFDLYSNKEFVEYNNVVINDSVKDVSAKSTTTLSDNEYIISNEILSNGDVIILPGTKEHPEGIAKKVVSVNVDGDNSVIETVEPELEEIFDNFEFAQKVSPTIDNFILEPGVTINDNEEINLEDVLKKAEIEEQSLNENSKPIVSTLGMAGKKEVNTVDTAVFDSLSFNYSFTKGQVSVSPKFNFGDTEFSASYKNMKEFNQGAFEECGKFFKDKTTFSFKDLPYYGTTKDGWEKSLNGGGKFSGGYDVSGNLKLSDLVVETELKLKKFLGVPYGIDYFKVQLGSQITLSTNFKGTIDHEIKIATTPVPTPIPGVTVNINFYLLISAEGTITVTVGIGNNVITEYSGGNWRKTQTSNSEASIEAAISVEFGPAIGLSVNAFSIEIIDVRLDAQGLLEASAKAACEVTEINMNVSHYKCYISLNVDFYAPTITLEIGTKNTLAKKIGISAKWKLVTKDKCAFHKEIYNKEWIIFEYDDEIEELTDDTNLGLTDESNVDGGNIMNFQIDTYAITLVVGESQEIGADVPNGYSVTDIKWSSSDNNVARVDSNGNVTAVSEGTATVTASLNGRELKCTVITIEE